MSKIDIAVVISKHLDDLMKTFHELAEAEKISEYQRLVTLERVGIDPDVYEDWLNDN